MSTRPFIKIVLDQPRVIRFSNRAIQRVGELDSALGIEDLNHKKKRQAALMQWLWGCLADEDATAFKSPADLAEVLPCPLPLERRNELLQGLVDAIHLTQPKDEKNAERSTPSPGPASSSA